MVNNTKKVKKGEEAAVEEEDVDNIETENKYDVENDGDLITNRKNKNKKHNEKNIPC